MMRKTSEKTIQQKHKTQWKATLNRIEQVEDRISDLEDKIGIKGKTEEMFVKQVKSYERNMQKLTY
jgi:hypothetical protein